MDPDGALNVLGEPLAACSTSPLTGFYRNGFCSAGPEDAGRHLVCCEMTDDFLAFSKARGNDLSTARPEYAFPGLVAGDRWCLVAERWAEALEAGQAPRVALLSTHQAVLGRISLADLKRHALDLS
ncbi:DUF2237 domain-containing protein [Devosia sp.]|uniref:DUF2237 family protein n=1 Tax=Devosia sp. TaxID=1871048 RepID=UPI0032648A3C